MAIRLVADQPRRPILYGAGAPDAALGVIGDSYVDTTGHSYYEKTGTTTWTLRFDMQGPAGSAGSGGGFPIATDRVVFVSATGNDANDGLSWATAKRTFGGALTVGTGAGWTFMFGSGTFTENVTLVSGRTIRVVGVNSAGGTAGTKFMPATDDGTVLKLDACNSCVFENIQFRNDARAGWRGVFIHVANASFNNFTNCEVTNSTGVANPNAGQLGGTGVLFTRGEGNRFKNFKCSGTHLAVHIGREASLPIFEGLQNSGNFHGRVIDSDVGLIYDDLSTITGWPFQQGSTAILNASGGQLAAVGTGTAQTWKYDNLVWDVAWVPLSGRNAAKVTVGAGGFGLTVKGPVVQPAAASAQNPIDGGTLDLVSTAGLPTSGYVFWVSGEVIRYTGITGNTLTGIARAQAGTPNKGSINGLHILYVPTGDTLVGWITPTDISIRKLEGGVLSAALASTALTSASGSVRYLDFAFFDDDVYLSAYAADPWNPGDSWWLVGTPLAEVSYTLTGADSTKYGVGVQGAMGHYLVATDTVWRIDDSRIRSHAGAPSGGGTFIRWKDVANPTQIKRDGTTINRTTNIATKPWEYYVYHEEAVNGRNGTNNSVYIIDDLTEGADGKGVIGDWSSAFIGCYANIDLYYTGSYCVHDSTKSGGGGRITFSAETVGNKIASSWTGSVVDNGDNLWVTPRWISSAPEKSVPNGVILGARSDFAATARTIPDGSRIPVGGYGGHRAMVGAPADTLQIAYNGGAGNAYMIPIYLGHQARLGWDQITFEVTTAGTTGALLAWGLYALDPQSLMPVASGQAQARSRISAGVATVNVATTGEKPTAFTEEITSTRWLGVMVFQRNLGGGAVTYRAHRGRALFGHGATVNTGPLICARFSVAEPGNLPDNPTFHSYSELAPVVRLRRSS